ncbi:class I adenylate-forming enzyme family protein [Metabacillus litoralis]|uniref:class I adenylate-forming enzyme family protein n=1 Tax=Metabacillus litoralis TaxID=152268 RepID=UPI001CFE8395|nr:AMP-binding protein [Metabacillus litoralis]
MSDDWLGKRANLSPVNIALIDGETQEEWTYKKLHDKALQWALLFNYRKIKKGDRVLLLAKNTPVFFELLFACSKVGCVLVPLNWRLSQQELTEIINHAEPALLFLDQEAEKSFPSLKELGYEWRSLSTALFHVHNTEESKQLLGHNEEEEELPWLMIYTGGTTGKPKGVVLTNKSVNWNAYNTIISWGLSSDDKTLTYLPLFHTGGINALSIPILMAGGTVIVANKFSSKEAVHLLHDYQCTIALFVPTMYHMLVEDDLFRKMPFSSMKAFLSGGAPCPISVYDKFQEKNLPFKEGYGLTEAGPNNFYIHPNDAKRKKGSVGKPMLLNDIKIVDEEGKEVETNEVGELLIKGNHLFKNYFKNQSATNEALRNGWLHTGDLARVDQDGDYYIVGRKKEMIISGGENIYPLEIENVLLAHPYVKEATVIGVNDDKWGEKVVAYVSQKKAKVFTSQQIIDYMRQILASYKIPKEIVILDELPKTDVGKINKKKLLNEYNKVV